MAAPVAGVPSVAALSSAGLVFGTLPYMSPEQLRGEKSDARTDIFAFGVLLHEMLTGIRPFAADSHAALIATILEHDPPPVSDRQPLAPASLDRIVQKCVANWDLSVFKHFPLGGTRRLQLRVELYNAFNTHQWTTVNAHAEFDFRTRALANPTVFGNLAASPATRPARAGSSWRPGSRSESISARSKSERS